MSSFELSARQAQAILDMRLAKLTGLEREALIAEIDGGGGADRAPGGDPGQRGGPDEGRHRRAGGGARRSTATTRRTEIIDDGAEIDVEDMIAPEEMVVTVTHGGYVKRNPKTLYRAQRRGGRGITGAATHEEDFVAQLFVASTHDTLLMFTNKGRAYSKKVWEVPAGGPHRQGQGVRQPDPAAGGRARRGAAAGARVLRGRVRGHGDPRAAYIKKTSLDAVRQHPQLGHHRADDRRRRRSGRRAHHRGRVRHPARHAQRLGDPLPRGERAPDGPHRARRARHQAARGRATRWSAWRSSRATRRRRC